MRVYIQRTGHRSVHLALPTALFCNSLTASVVARTRAKRQKEEGEKESSPTPSKKQLRELFREIRRLKKRLRKSDWRLCEVESADGTRVTVRL